MYYFYALQSLKNKKWLYVGYSDDLKKRYETHRDGKVKSTKFYLPLKLVYYEAYVCKSDATKREYNLKNLSKPSTKVSVVLGIRPLTTFCEKW